MNWCFHGESHENVRSPPEQFAIFHNSLPLGNIAYMYSKQLQKGSILKIKIFVKIQIVMKSFLHFKTTTFNESVISLTMGKVMFCTTSFNVYWEYSKCVINMTSFKTNPVPQMCIYINVSCFLTEWVNLRTESAHLQVVQYVRWVGHPYPHHTTVRNDRYQLLQKVHYGHSNVYTIGPSVLTSQPQLTHTLC